MLRKFFVFLVIGCILVALGRVVFGDPQGGFEWVKQKASDFSTWATELGDNAKDVVERAPDAPNIIPTPGTSGKNDRQEGTSKPETSKTE